MSENEIQKAVAIIKAKAAQAFTHWDEGSDHKAGKMLKALSGQSLGYDDDLDRAFAGLESHAAEWDAVKGHLGLMLNPVIRTAVSEHISARYKTIKMDSCFSAAHKLYQMGDALLGPSMVVEWHDSRVWFSPDGDGVEISEYPIKRISLPKKSDDE